MKQVPDWKKDFPVSWVDDHYVTRREFTKSLVLVSGSTFAATGALVALGRIGPGAKPEKKFVALASEVGDKGLVFEFGGEPCLLLPAGPEKFVAFGQKCTHLGCPVIYRRKKKDLYCPCHEGLFDLEGKVVAGPPPRPLPVVELKHEGDELWAVAIRR